MRAVLVLAALLALPLVGALPGTCGAECEVASASTGYTPPAAVIASGSTVTWRSTDIGHITVDGPLAGGEKCFVAVSSVEEPSAAVRFDVVDGALFATSGDETLPCAGAVGDEAAGFTLSYFCTLHPSMRGALVVVAS